MTMEPRLVRNLPGILEDLSAAPSPDYIDDVFVRTGRMRQRPAWTFPERWLPMADITRARAFAPAPPWRLIALALVIVALLVGALIYVGASRQVPAPPFGPARNGLIPYELKGDLYVGDPVTGNNRLVIGGSTDDNSPGFSPDGTLLAFLRLNSRECCMTSDLFVVRPDGSDIRRVSTASFPSDAWVNWAPDSRHFAMITTVAGHDEIDMIDLDGRTQRLAVGLDPMYVTFRPPLGQEILFRSDTGGKAAALYAMRADGTDIRPLIYDPDGVDNPLNLGGAVYSADGSRIFFQKAYRAAPGSGPDDHCCKLWVMGADGSNPHQFVNDTLDSWEGEPAVSPDGRSVAFWRVSGGTAKVAVIRADGSGPVIQTGPNLNGLADWLWAPDSSKILMIPHDAADTPAHYLLDPSGGQWTKTAWTSGTGWTATSGPDWQRLAP